MFFEEFDFETVLISHRVKVTEQMVLDFALQYDSQPFHLDPEHPTCQEFGGFFASGYQALSLSLRLGIDSGIFAQNIIGLGLDNVRWLHPLMAGSIVYCTHRALVLKPSKSKPDRGVVTLETQMRDQDDTLLMRAELSIMVRRKPDSGIVLE